MELIPRSQLGWLNGWILLAVYGLVLLGMLGSFPREVVARLFYEPASHKTSVEKAAKAIGQLAAFAFIALALFSPLKIRAITGYLGLGIYVLGMGTVIKALVDFRDTPMDQPVTRGVYHISRNPQWVGLALVFLGTAIVISAWLALALVGVVIVSYHFEILTEERVCLEQYGEAYAAYLKRIPRYLGFDREISP